MHSWFAIWMKITLPRASQTSWRAKIISVQTQASRLGRKKYSHPGTAYYLGACFFMWKIKALTVGNYDNTTIQHLLFCLLWDTWIWLALLFTNNKHWLVLLLLVLWYDFMLNPVWQTLRANFFGYTGILWPTQCSL